MNKLETEHLTAEEAYQDTQQWNSLSDFSKQQIIDAFKNEQRYHEQLYWYYIFCKEKCQYFKKTNDLTKKMDTIRYLGLGTEFNVVMPVNDKIIGSSYFAKKECKYSIRLLNEVRKMHYNDLSREHKLRLTEYAQIFEDSD